MNTITVKQAERNLKKVIRRTVNNVEPSVVITENGESVVILSLSEYNAWQKTLYLLSTPANAEHLRRSIAEDQAGYATERQLIDP
jgi:antitoxin YefM